jgi:hypothetical protein
VSGFEEGQRTAALGTWMPSPDSFAGGRSTGEVSVVEGGAQGGAYALEVRGTISDLLPDAWSGVMWSPGLASDRR